jgi:hypothetical protein
MCYEILLEAAQVITIDMGFLHNKRDLGGESGSLDCPDYPPWRLANRAIRAVQPQIPRSDLPTVIQLPSQQHPIQPHLFNELIPCHQAHGLLLECRLEDLQTRCAERSVPCSWWLLSIKRTLSAASEGGNNAQTGEYCILWDAFE